MRGRARRRLAAGLCVLSLLLVGCTDSRDTPPATAADSPLEEFFGTGFGGNQEFSEADRQLHYQLEELVVECMARQGFEYHPQPFWGDEGGGSVRDDAAAGADAGLEEVWQLQVDDPEAFATRYGYGITTLPAADGATPGASDPTQDPNLRYEQSLSPSAQEEYRKALWGDWDSLTDEELQGDGGPARISAGGCRAEASDEVYALEERFAQAEQFAELEQELAALEDRIANDPRLAEATQAWATCMAEAGYAGLQELGDGQAAVGDRLAAAAGDEPEEPDPAVLEEVRRFELAVAGADFTCRREHDVDDIARDVRFDLEQQFIEDHRAQLEAYRDWANERPAG